jgi:hypothetical protein
MGRVEKFKKKKGNFRNEDAQEDMRHARKNRLRKNKSSKYPIKRLLEQEQ